VGQTDTRTRDQWITNRPIAANPPVACLALWSNRFGCRNRPALTATSSGITQAELAKAVGTGPRSVQNWASGHNAPRGRSAEKLLDVHAIVGILSGSYTPEGIDIWFHSRNRNLDMRRPINLLTEGDFDRVLDEAKWVAGGM
jgi:transcriptional regulator with XRE-family HTH domain